MPKVEKIEPKDVHVFIDFPISELRMLMNALSMSSIKFDGNDVEQKKTANYFNEFYEFLYKFFDEVDGNGS